MLPSQNNEQAPLCYIDQKKVNKYNYYTFFCVLFMAFAPRELYMNNMHIGRPNFLPLSKKFSRPIHYPWTQGKVCLFISF